MTRFTKMNIVLLFIGSIILTGCSNSEIEIQNSKSSNVGGYEMNDEEKELLRKMSVNEEKVENGMIADWQKEIINQYRYTIAYLSEKYPSYQFKITECEPQNRLNEYTTFQFTQKDESDVFFDLYLYVTESGDTISYEAEDNFYGSLIETELGNSILQLIINKFPECTNVKTNIAGVAGREYNENLNIQQIISGKINVDHKSIIVMNLESSNELVYQEKTQEIKEFIDNTEITGSYGVEIYDINDNTKLMYEEYFFVE